MPRYMVRHERIKVAFKIKFSNQLTLQKTKIMASGPITSWEIDGETVETVSDFILGDRKSTRLNSSHSGQSRMPSSA